MGFILRCESRRTPKHLILVKLFIWIFLLPMVKEIRHLFNKDIIVSNFEILWTQNDKLLNLRKGGSFP